MRVRIPGPPTVQRRLFWILFKIWVKTRTAWRFHSPEAPTEPLFERDAFWGPIGLMIAFLGITLSLVLKDPRIGLWLSAPFAIWAWVVAARYFPRRGPRFTTTLLGVLLILSIVAVVSTKLACKVHARIRTDIVSRLYARMAAPGPGVTISSGFELQEFFYDWKLSVDTTCDIDQMEVVITGNPTIKNDRVSTMPDGAVYSFKPVWLSGFNEPRAPDRYEARIAFSGIKAGASWVVLRHAMALPGLDTTFNESYFERSVRINSVDAQIEAYDKQANAQRLIGNFAVLAAKNYNPPHEPRVLTRRNPNEPLAALEAGQVEVTMEVRCKDSHCTELTLSDREIRRP